MERVKNKIIFIDSDQEQLLDFQKMLPSLYHYSAGIDSTSGALSLGEQLSYEVLVATSFETANSVVQRGLESKERISLAFVSFKKGSDSDSGSDSDFDGIAIATELKEKDPKLRVVFTASCSRSEKLEIAGKKLKADIIYFQRPFKVWFLERLIEQHFTTYEDEQLLQLAA